MRHVALVTMALSVWAGSSAALGAQSKGTDTKREEFEANLGYQTGTVTLNGGLATIRVPPSFRFCGT